MKTIMKMTAPFIIFLGVLYGAQLFVTALARLTESGVDQCQLLRSDDNLGYMRCTRIPGSTAQPDGANTLLYAQMLSDDQRQVLKNLDTVPCSFEQYDVAIGTYRLWTETLYLIPCQRIRYTMIERKYVASGR